MRRVAAAAAAPRARHRGGGGTLADVQVTGFGLTSTYHANNEYCLLSDMEKGFRILAHTIANLL